MKRATKKRTPHSFSKPRLSPFASGHLREWNRLELPLKPTTVVVAVSGGADSTALFLALHELFTKKKLKLRLIVAHVNHGLRGDAGAEDARRVKALATELGYLSALRRINVRKKATRMRDNIEQMARLVRYEFLEQTANKKQAKIVLTGHTLDDQAETVLLNLIRGSGADGLGAMEPVRPFHPKGKAILARPLLAWAKRVETEKYCRTQGVDYCHDEMNVDEKFARVRVRQEVVPLLKTFNGKIVETLSRTAELLRADSAALNGAAERLLEFASRLSPATRTDAMPALDVDLLMLAPAAIRRRALRQWIARGRGDLRRVEFVHLRALEGLLSGNRGGRTIELPGGAKVSRLRGRLRFHGGKR
ncbi:MAG TPA: tRNA lysidine(34) synthetase TilS [Pyrinomonadaceae bacterium]|nr:tRNA lysidine(34) synthetase TilS [Pyrinomonadaceae bacterium]